MIAPADRLSTPPEAQVFSRPLFADEVPDEGLDIMVEADPSECVAIAREIGLPALHALAGRYRITRRSGRRLQVDGSVEARITQICVVSLEPFDSDVTQDVEATFAPGAAPDRQLHHRHAGTTSRRLGAPQAREAAAAAPPDDKSADPADPIIDGRIDLGALAVEFLTLALDFYPRKPGVEFSDVVVGETDAPKPSAFAALARLKDRS